MEVIVVLNIPCKPNMMKQNVNNKRNDEFVERFFPHMTTNFVLHDTNCNRLIILVIPNTYGNHIKKYNKYSRMFNCVSFILYAACSITT